MIFWIPAAILCAIIGLVYLGSAKFMNRALHDLGHIQSLAEKEFMACKCQEKNPTEETPCAENELSFKQAYLKLNKQYVQVCAQRQELNNRLEAFQAGAKNIIKNIDEEKQKVQIYLVKALDSMDSTQKEQFIKTYGPIPGGIVL